MAPRDARQNVHRKRSKTGPAEGFWGGGIRDTAYCLLPACCRRFRDESFQSCAEYKVPFYCISRRNMGEEQAKLITSYELNNCNITGRTHSYYIVVHSNRFRDKCPRFPRRILYRFTWQHDIVVLFSTT